MRDTINSIPSFGFINNPEQRRGALFNKINAIDNMLTANNTFGARQKLQHDIKDKFEKWLVDYKPENILQPTKADLSKLIDEMILRLS